MKLLVLLLVIIIGLRFLFLEIDPPYGIVSTSGDFVTDEGWYAKGAIMEMKFGQWINPQDRNFQIAAPFHNVLLALVFKVAGVNLIAARWVALTAFVFTLLLFYAILRADFSPFTSIVGCLFIAVGVENFAFSRLALTEPIAAFLTLAALSLWIFFPGRLWACSASLALASLAFFEKLIFIHVPLILALLWGGDLWVYIRQKKRQQALSIGLAMLLIWSATLIGFLALRQMSPEDWTAMSQRTQEAFFSWRHPKGVFNLFGAFALVIKRHETTLPMFICLLGVWALIFRYPQAPDKKSISRRAWKAMALWGSVAFLAVGINYYQPERYFYFFIFPAVYFALYFIHRFISERYFVSILLTFLAMQIAWQIPSYVRWSRLSQQSNYVSIARDIARIVTADNHQEVVLMGDISAFISFFPGKIRPISMTFTEKPQLCQFARHWKPAYVITDKPIAFLSQCFESHVNIVPLKNYVVMNNYYGNLYTLYQVNGH